MHKYEHVAEILKKRILNGDYAVKDIPSERQLAEEFAVSYVTARRAVQELLQAGLVTRESTCRLQVMTNLHRQGQSGQIAFLAPAFASPEIEGWRVAITQAASHYKYIVRSIMFTHWDDPVILDALESFDGVFLYPVAEEISEAMVKRLSVAHGLVVIDMDLAYAGIPSIRLRTPVFAQKLLDHLAATGHQKIDCFNTQPVDRYLDSCMAQWHLWMLAHQYQGELINEPVISYGKPEEQAYRVMSNRLQQGLHSGTALFCLTMPAVLGAMRACYEHGLRVGKDIAICSMSGERIASYLTPSVTTLREVDLVPFTLVCMDWIAQGAQAWVGPLLLTEEQAELAIGESTTTGYRLASDQDLPVYAQ